MKISFKFEGGTELAAAFADLSTRLSSKVMREVLTEAAEPIRKTASSLAPYRAPAPDIRANIITSYPTKSVHLDVRSEMAVVAIGPAAKEFAYGLPQELGSINNPAHPFMRPAFDANIQRALDMVSEASWRELAGRGISRSASVDTVVEGEV